MSWFKDNPFIAGILAVCIVGTGVLGYLIVQSVADYSTSSEAYMAAAAKLHTLQNKAPFPSEANLKAIQAGLEDYSSHIKSLQSQLAKMEVPLDEKLTAQQFQDGLRTAVNDIRVRADANGVKLPANFYFGFDQYQSQVPSEKAAPFLQRQFLVIQSLVVRLVDFKVTSIDGVNRVPLPQESATASAGQRKPDTAEPAPSSFPFDISFTAEQPKFRVAFNSLLGSDQFLIVRSLDIHNSVPQAPAKKGADPVASNPLAAGAGAAPGKGQANMQVILGREVLKVTLHLEILNFAQPPPAKK